MTTAARRTRRTERRDERWWSLGPGVTREGLRDALAHIVDRYRPHVPLMSAMHDAAGADPAAVGRLVDAYAHIVWNALYATARPPLGG